MRIKQEHYLGEYDQEIGRNPLFSTVTIVTGLPIGYEVDSVEVVVKDKEGSYMTYSCPKR